MKAVQLAIIRLLPILYALVAVIISSSAFRVAQAQQPWSTARLSIARCCLAATSLGNVSFFAGGGSVVDIYDSTTRAWSTAQLSVGRKYLAAVSVGTFALFVGGSSTGHQSGAVNVVDLYSSANKAWSTAQLSASRSRLAATSVGNLALFAGGENNGVCLCRGRLLGILFSCA
jgi:hypothetical protein